MSVIKTRTATNEYRNNFDAIFRKGSEMKRFTVPVDFSIMAKDAEEAEQKAFNFVINSVRDIGPTYNVLDGVFPVGYPTEPDIIDV